MRIASRSIAALSVLACGSTVLAGGGTWVDFDNETSTRMPASLNDPATSISDNQEKDYAWGDIDHDGDIDLVCVRKEPFTSTGKRVNVLFMNEGIAEGHAMNGIFVDRTVEYATASDVSGDEGFQTPTNDRDVVLADLDADGWLDMVTATTLTDNQAKHLSHPRVYMNLGELDGDWLGFRYEDARIPQMHPTAGPRFCSVAAGDVTGDGFPDLYFGDYDSGGSQIHDYNNKLLINDGNGFFSDESNARLTNEMRESAFGAASVIADINDDEVMDVVKQTSLASPTHVAVTYNDPGNQGIFNGYDTVYDSAPYFVSVGDLNNDGRLDIIIVDDGTDRYLLNTGNGGGNQANWTEHTFPSGPSSGFGGNSFIADLNNDGNNDVLITDVDVDIPGCSRRMHIYRNLGNTPNVSFQEQGQVIPDSMLSGTHDVAVFDINEDGWLDLVVGRCGSTEIWINVPPVGLVFAYPAGLPVFLEPDVETEFQVQVSAFGGGAPEPGSARIHISTDGGAFIETTMQDLSGDLYGATLPATSCPEKVRFYLSAETETGDPFTDPPGAPGNYYTATAAQGTQITLRDEMEEDTSGWTIINDGATSGVWEAVDPNGTISGGAFAAPEDDATAGEENVKAFVTENGPVGGGAAANDIDGGPIHLISETLDLEGTDALISYARWMFCDDEDSVDADVLTVYVSNNGGTTWTIVPSQTTGSTSGAWENTSFVVGDFIVPTAEVVIRFSAEDRPNNSVTEAGIDNFQVETFVCPGDSCAQDVDGDGSVGFTDLLEVLSFWGPCPGGCPQDIDGDELVGFTDLLDILSFWGPCP